MYTKRLSSLDSLRGIAALIVILYHCLLVSPNLFNSNSSVATVASYLLTRTPLATFRAGSQAVLLFFVLSGFVLSLPFFTRTIPYDYFVIRRIFRIWIPYIIAIAFAIVMKSLVSKGGIVGLSYWFNTHWKTPFNLKIACQYFFMLDHFPYHVFNTVTWSLVYEMRISLLFPLVMLLLLRTSWKQGLITMLIFGFCGFILFMISNAIHSSRLNDYIISIAYIPLFITGVILAKYRLSIVSKYNSLSPIFQNCLLFAGFCCFSHPIWLHHNLGPFSSITKNLLILYGIAMFIIAALSQNYFAKVLETKPLMLIGKISYSIYLYHGTVLFTCIYIFYGLLSLWLIFAMTFVITILLSYISYIFIELPAINLGHKLSEKLANRTTLRSGITESVPVTV